MLIYSLTPAVAQWVGAFDLQAEGWVFEFWRLHMSENSRVGKKTIKQTNR